MKNYRICTGPVGIPNDETVTILMNAMEHLVRGVHVKGLQVADMGYFQVIDDRDSVVFCAPAHTVLWCIEEYPSGDVTPLHALGESHELEEI